MKTGIIIAGGDLPPVFAEKVIREYAAAGEIVTAAADAGLEVLDRIGMAPDILLGDFDTVKERVLGKYLTRPDIQVERHDPVKDASDMELTVKTLYRQGIRKAVVLGALGGRADHTLANIRLTYYAVLRGMELLILDPQNRIRCLKAYPDRETVFTLRKDAQYGKYVSVFPAGGSIAPLTMEGFRYPLAGYTLDWLGEPSRTVSNEITEEEAVIRFRGTEDAGLIVMETGDAVKEAPEK